MLSINEYGVIEIPSIRDLPPSPEVIEAAIEECRQAVLAVGKA